ncbi:MAG: peptide chain release factor 2 [Pseudomonadota bacterium]|nr:peptide chain release factor 2 [Pseudomonadota bacterium]
MRADLQNIVDEIQQSLELLRRHLDLEKSKKELERLNKCAEDPNLWDNPETAQIIMRDRTRLSEAMNGFWQMEQGLMDNLELIEMAEAEGDNEVAADAEKALIKLKKEAARRQLESLLSGEADGNDCYLEVHAGAGGTESQDWAEMLSRMYARWSDNHGCKVELLEESAGEEAGIKSITFKISGINSYGWLKTESGVHRLVRISPFDSASRRHTSFASVGVYPVIDESIAIEIVDSEIRIDTYRASGAGGQHVNRTDSAVRITHEPTGIVVQCQNDRSQHRNRATAMTMLKARLYQLELKKREDKAAADHAAKTEIGWGHQIRSYVLHPYKMVKDLRTAVEKSNAEGVLDGDIDDFLEAALAERVIGNRENGMQGQ